MFTEEDLAEARQFLQEQNLPIARFEPTVVRLMDGDVPIKTLAPPHSLWQSEAFSIGLAHLQQRRPATALLQTRHLDESDFWRLLNYAGGIMLDSPVCGVEAFASEAFTDNGIPSPKPYTPEINRWRSAFQSAQLPWLKSNGITALPCEPEWDEVLRGRIDIPDQIFGALYGGNTLGLSEGARHILMHILDVYTSIYRSWGIVGQFGNMLRLPGVNRLTKDCSELRIPIILDVGHLLECRILQHYCGIDLLILTTDRQNDFSPLSIARHDIYLTSAIHLQYLTVADLLCNRYPARS